QAADLQKKLLAKSPSDPRSNEALGRTLNAQARIFHKLHRLDEAADFYREAVACRNDLVRMNPGDDEYRRQLANSIMNLGLVQRDRGEFPLAAQQFEQASSLRQGFESLGPEFRRDLSRGYYNWGDLRLEEQRLEEAVRFFEQSAVLLESLLEDTSHSLEDRYRLALCRRLQGDAASGQYFEKLSTKSYQQALKSHEQAMESLNILIFWNPDVPLYLEEYANIELNLGFLLQHQGQFERAEELFTDAKERFSRLVAKDPHEFNYRFAQLLATKEVELTLARRTDLEDRTAQTRKVLEELQQRFQELQREFPERSEVGVQLDQIKELLDKLNASNPQPTTPTDL
ncbi:MAG TPA: tetratricopeptide repeat protein, partial [Planctomycetaceae bacterium]|nr:tetratricopeptide repeat protein [Planctomycetaceae bacterium]